jgi:hypothetical protein
MSPPQVYIQEKSFSRRGADYTGVQCCGGICSIDNDFAAKLRNSRESSKMLSNGSSTLAGETK